MPVGSCSCCGGCNPCLVGIPPTTILCTFSGVTTCGSVCTQITSGLWVGIRDATFTAVSPDGAYCLTFDPTPYPVFGAGALICQHHYKATIPSPTVVTVYNSADGSCSGGTLMTILIDTINLTINAFAPDTFSLEINIRSPDIGLSSLTVFRYNAVSGQTASRCVDGTYSNQNTTCASIFFAGPVAKDGSAALVMNGC